MLLDEIAAFSSTIFCDLALTVKLSTDFSKLNYVYLVENTRFQELDSLYRQSDLINEY